jgi:hypothetical protein
MLHQLVWYLKVKFNTKQYAPENAFDWIFQEKVNFFKFSREKKKKNKEDLQWVCNPLRMRGNQRAQRHRRACHRLIVAYGSSSLFLSFFLSLALCL